MGFTVIAKSAFREFWERYPDSQDALEVWYKLLRQGEFKNFAELKAIFGSVDFVQPDFLVFDIRGNHYRIVVSVNFVYKTIWIKHVLTHKEYDLWRAK
jgi:mRNA interferase HigB